MKARDLYAHLPVPVQNAACTLAGWQRWRARFTADFHRQLDELERTCFSSDEELRLLQWMRLQNLVVRARRHVPHYRRQDLPPAVDADNTLESIERTLAGFPVLYKEDYASEPSAFVAEDVPKNRLHHGRTSGTTGTALPLWYTRAALAAEYATVWRLRRQRGIGLGDPHFTFGGQIVVPFEQTKPPFWRMNWWGRQVLFSLYHMTPENLDAYIAAIHELPARYAQGYPSSLHLIGQAMLESGRAVPAGKLDAVFTSSESLLAFQRDTIRQAFGAPVFDRYGTSEFCVSMTACDKHALHVDMEFGIVEVDVQEESEEWVRGPLLVTGLANDATPFIRYAVGDVGTRAKKPCPCGRPGDVFLDIDGRIEDYVVTADGRMVGRLDHVFKDQLDVAEAQILQEKADAISVLVVPRSSWTDRSERSLRGEIAARLGSSMSVDIRLVDAIPREPNGKFRAVKSTVGGLRH